MTPEVLSKCTGAMMVNAKLFAEFFTLAMVEFDISTPKRQAAYLAQLGHESAGLHFMNEIWGPTAAQKRYERNFNAPWPATPGEAKTDKFAVNRLAYTLGNFQVGDGKRFMGHGPIQITGRTNHASMGEFLKLDLIKNPELLTIPANGCRSSGAYWKRRGLNELADIDDFITITKRINGGTNGLADRQARWAKAKIELGVE